VPNEPEVGEWDLVGDYDDDLYFADCAPPMPTKDDLVERFAEGDEPTCDAPRQQWTVYLTTTRYWFEWSPDERAWLENEETYFTEETEVVARPTDVDCGTPPTGGEDGRARARLAFTGPSDATLGYLIVAGAAALAGAALIAAAHP